MADDRFFHRLSVRDGINTNETDKHRGTGYSSGMHTMAYLVHPGECREKENNQTRKEEALMKKQKKKSATGGIPDPEALSKITIFYYNRIRRKKKDVFEQ